jgi:hypothetical protein
MASENDILRFVIEYGIPAASAVLNVFYHRIGGDASDGDIMDDYEAWIVNNWQPGWEDFAGQAASIIGYSVDVINLDGTVGANVGSRSLSIDGTVVEEVAASGLCGYMKADTDKPKTRGSKYIPGITEGEIDGGLLDLTTVADLLLMLVDLVTPFTGANSAVPYTPGVISRPSETWEPFNGNGTVTDVPAYQRRRKPNVGS